MKHICAGVFSMMAVAAVDWIGQKTDSRGDELSRRTEILCGSIMDIP